MRVGYSFSWTFFDGYVIDQGIYLKWSISFGVRIENENLMINSFYFDQRYTCQRVGESPILSNLVCRFAALAGFFKFISLRPDKRKNLKRPNVRSLKIYSDIRFNERSKTDIARILLSGKWLMCQRPLFPVSSKLEDWFDFRPLYPLPSALQFLKDFRSPVWIKLPADYLRQPNCLSSARAIDRRAIYVDDPGCNLSAIPRTWSLLPEGWKTSKRSVIPCVRFRSFVRCIRFALVCLVVWTV